MAIFRYEAADETGKLLQGSVEADSPRAVRGCYAAAA